MKWNEVTWYSRLAALIIFLGVIPALCFFLGVQYEKVKQLPPEDDGGPIILEKVTVKKEEVPVEKYDHTIPSEYLQTDLPENWDLYIDEKLKFSFAYPSSWRLEGNLRTAQLPYIRVENRPIDDVTASTTPYYKFEIVKIGKASSTPLQEWLEERNESDEYNPQISNVTEMKVSGYPAIRQTAVYLGKYGGPDLYVDKGDQVYVISSNSMSAEFQSIVNALQSSLTFYE